MQAPTPLELSFKCPIHEATAASNNIASCMVRCCTRGCCWQLDGRSIHWQQLLETSKMLTISDVTGTSMIGDALHDHVKGKYVCVACYKQQCCCIVLCATLSPPATVAGNNIASCMGHLNDCHDHHCYYLFSPMAVCSFLAD